MATLDRTVHSPNFYSGWPNGKPKLVIIHSTRGDRREPTWTDADELQATLNWFTKRDHALPDGTRARNPSAHWVISETEKVRVVPDEDRAWHAAEDNNRAFGIEVTQTVEETRYEDGHYRNLVEVCQDYVAMGVPVVHVPGPSTVNVEGFIGHEETVQGQRIGKSDPGFRFDWDKFVAMLSTEEEMKPYLVQEQGAPFVWITDNLTRTYLRDISHAEALGIETQVKVVPPGTLQSLPRVDKPD